MLIFPKRKIVEMMRDVYPRMLKKDRRKHAKQLDRTEDSNAIQALWELAIVWSLLEASIGTIPVRKPNIGAEPDIEIDIGLDKTVVLEVTAPSGDTFSFKEKFEIFSRTIFENCVNVSVQTSKSRYQSIMMNGSAWGCQTSRAFGRG